MVISKKDKERVLEAIRKGAIDLDFVSLKLKKLGKTGIDKIWTSILSLHHLLIPINSGV